jgi:hypothetical protein
VTLSPREETRGPRGDFANIPLGEPTGAAAALTATLKVGRTDDPAEGEADRLVDQVMRTPAAGTSLAHVPARGAEAGTAVRQTPANGSAIGAQATDLLSGSGRALDVPTLTFFEPRFGLNLSRVRIHTDDRAARSAAAIGARAFAAGAHIGFAPNQYAPATPSGRRLLAHELAHVAQAVSWPGVETVVRRSPVDPVMYSTGRQTFSPPAAGDTVASLKAGVAATQATKPDPSLGPTVEVKGVTAGQDEELFLWNALLQRADRKNWGTEIQVVTQIGRKPAQPPGAPPPVGKINITIDKKGNATAELVDKGAVGEPDAFPDKDKAIAALKRDFAFASVDDGTAVWTTSELNKVHAALRLLPSDDRANLAGAALVRDSTLTGKDGKPSDGEFRHSHSVNKGAPGSPSVASHESSLHLAKSAFDADSAGFVGEKGKAVLPSLRLVLHEAGHAAETKSLRDAEFATDVAQAAANNENVGTSVAVDAANAAAQAAFASAKAYRGPVWSAARDFVGAFQAALVAVDAYANNATGSRFATFETAAKRAIATRDNAKAKLPAGHPALTDFATALTTQDAWFAQAQVRAKASINLDASKKAQAGVSDAKGKTSKRLETFVALVKTYKIQPLTQYAKDNWPASPEEFFAEAYSLWLTNPAYLKDNAPVLKAWFDSSYQMPAIPDLIKSREAQTGWINDPAPSGTLDEKSWVGEKGEKKISDLAKVAQTKKIFTGPAALKDPDAVNSVDKPGAPYKPGLNYSKDLASGVTSYVDPAGGPKVFRLNPSRTEPLPKIAIALTDYALADKQQALTTLRHEMMHAEHLNMTLSEAEKWQKDKKSTATFEDWMDEQQKSKKITDVDRILIRESTDLYKSRANTELLAHAEGFMTAFLLKNPPPKDNGDSAFRQLLGMISSSAEPWANAQEATRALALGRIQHYYCQVLDQPHQKAFEDFVSKPPNSPPSYYGDWRWAPKPQLHEHFFAGLKKIIDANCKDLGGTKKPASSGSSTPKKSKGL